MSKVRIGFVGVGTMGQMAHLRNYATLTDECEVVALAEVRPELGRKVAARWGVPKVYTSHEQMLKEEKFDGIVASQPFTRHGAMISELLKIRPIPVFIEKPLAASIEAAQKVLNALERSKAFVMVGYHKRSDPATMFARAEIDRLKSTGEIGKLKYVRILMPAGDWVAGGFNDLIQTTEQVPALASDAPASDMDEATFKQYVGFVNYYIHQVNLMRYLLGEPYRVTHADPAGVLLVGQSAGGATCTIEMSPYTTSHAWEESAFVAFERGYIDLRLPAPLTINRAGTVEIYKDPAAKQGVAPSPTRFSPTLPWDHAMRQQARNFIRAIKGEAKPPCDAHEAIQDLQVARDYMRLFTGR